MAERPSLTAQLQRAVVQAEKRLQSASNAAALLQAADNCGADQETEGFWGAGSMPATAFISYPSSLSGSFVCSTPSKAALRQAADNCGADPESEGFWAAGSLPAASISYPSSVSGSCLCSTASQESNWQYEAGWDWEVVSDSAGVIPELQREGSTSAYLEELLSDEGEEIQMLDDLLAYQMIHNELEDMIVNVSSKLETCGPLPAVRPSAARNREVESWVASFSSVMAPRGLPPPPAEREELQASNPDPVVQSEREDKSLQEVTDMLVECAEAVVSDDSFVATTLLSKIKRYSTPDGSHLQRLAYYFSEALLAKLNGTGADLYAAVMKRDKHVVLEAEKVYMSKDPTAVVGGHFGKSALLEAFAGARKVHIIDYGILGHTWQSLIQALAYRPEGPPRLRITGIELPQPGAHPDGMVKDTGRKLARLAASLGIPFEFKGFACKWEDVQISQLGLRDDEVLAVSSMFRLKNLLDDSVVLSNPRRTVLERICNMNPKVFIMADRSVAGNAPFLLSRLKEAIPSWYSFFEFLETMMPRDSVHRRIVEQENFGYRILNLIACEGMDRRERPEAYHQWHWRLVNAGFEQVALTERMLSFTTDILQDYHSDWTAGQDHGWILTGWKGRIHHAYSAWRPLRS